LVAVDRGWEILSRHIESVPVKEMFQGKTVWDGIVEVFEVEGHPRIPKVYAWSHDTQDSGKRKRHVTVLHMHPVASPLLAVRAAIIHEQRNLATEVSRKSDVPNYQAVRPWAALSQFDLMAMI
jgi:hypothetical protein